MIEVEYDDIEKIVQHTADTVLHKSNPETLRLVQEVRKDLAAYKEGRDAEIGAAVEKYVNGGIRKIQSTIDGFGKTLDAHIVRVEPMISSYEENQAFAKGIRKRGNWIIFWSAVVAGVLEVLHLFKRL